MDFTLSNNISQRQQNILTPKMVEELKILQMSNLELQDYLEEQILDNPLLELDNDEANLEDEFSYWDSSNSFYGKEYVYQGNNCETKDFTEYTSTPISLRDYLVSQINEISLPEKFRKVVMYLIENISEDGYLITNIEETAADMKMPRELIFKALRSIQKLEPAGVGARNLKECIWLQLYRKNQISQEITDIIKNHLSLLAQRKYSEIFSKTELNKDKIIEIHNLIKATDPKPGQKFAKHNSEFITPELVMKQINGKYDIFFNYDWNIELKLNNLYWKLLKSSNETKEINKYIKAKLQKAINTIRAVEQRKDTIIKVAAFILNYQIYFFKNGYKGMKPLTMKMVAESVGLHESTISRTVNGKYIQTPKGIFELKYFFSGQVEFDQNNSSSLYIKRSIEKTIRNEDKSKPFSDEQIRQVLELNGIKVARRTIAKYREELRILPANIRKHE